MSLNPYKSSRLTNDEPTVAPTTENVHPVESGTVTTVTAFLALMFVPVTGNARFHNDAWAWLDQFRIPGPHECGYFVYALASLAAALLLGLIVAGLHYLIWRVLSGTRWAGMTMLGIAFVVGLCAPYLFYRFPRMERPSPHAAVVGCVARNAPPQRLS